MSVTRTLLAALFALALACGAGAAGAQSKSDLVEDVDSAPAPSYGHLRYFGFYASAMGRWNFTAELAPFTNLTWIHVGSGDAPEAALEAMLQRLREAREAGVEATLSIEPFLFRNLRGDLRPDGEIEDFLVELRARIEVEGLLDTVALIYPKDEPFRQFIRYRDPSFYEQYVTGEVYADIHQTLVHANDLIKLAFPDSRSASPCPATTSFTGSSASQKTTTGSASTVTRICSRLATTAPSWISTSACWITCSHTSG